MIHERPSRVVAETARTARAWTRVPRSASRRLPDFLIVGGQRCGTTSLFNYLAAHPDVVPSLGKELHFFTKHWRHGPAWYRAHFPTIGEPGLTFEATPYYLYHPHAPWRAAQVVPRAKLIVLLRDPVTRAYSHYQHNRARRFEHLSFRDALAAEPERIEAELTKMLGHPGYESRAVQLYSYRSRGRYAEQLGRWLERFPRDRVLVLRSEALHRDTLATFARTLEFLGLREWLPRRFDVLARRSGRSAEPPTEEFEELREYYRPFNTRLARLLDTDDGWGSEGVPRPAFGGTP